MSPGLEARLIECLAALEGGESIDHILARYPDDAAQLRPMLVAAAGLPSLRMEPSQAARSKSRRAFLAAAAAAPVRPARARAVMRPLAAFAAATFVLILAGGLAIAASAPALPGDPLYGVKRAVEDARLSLASAETRGALAAQFERERIDEVNALLAAGRDAEVDFGGIIESVQPAAWVVAGVPVGIDARTQITGQPDIGRRARVRGRTASGLLTATSIVVEEGGEPEPTPPAPEPTPRPSPTPRHTPTPGSSATPKPTRTPTPTLPASATPAVIEFEGIVEQAGPSSWTISGSVVDVDAATDFRGNPGAGDRVAVRALRYGDGRLIALRIERIDGGGDNLNDNDDNQNGNDNQNENGNQNDNSNDNDNANDNQNDNSNDNGDNNSNDNGNGHGNGNSNDNDNGNDND